MPVDTSAVMPSADALAVRDSKHVERATEHQMSAKNAQQPATLADTIVDVIADVIASDDNATVTESDALAICPTHGIVLPCTNATTGIVTCVVPESDNDPAPTVRLALVSVIDAMIAEARAVESDDVREARETLAYLMMRPESAATLAARAACESEIHTLSGAASDARIDTIRTAYADLFAAIAPAPAPVKTSTSVKPASTRAGRDALRVPMPAPDETCDYDALVSDDPEYIGADLDDIAALDCTADDCQLVKLLTTAPKSSAILKAKITHSRDLDEEDETETHRDCVKLANHVLRLFKARGRLHSK